MQCWQDAVVRNQLASPLPPKKRHAETEAPRLRRFGLRRGLPAVSSLQTVHRYRFEGPQSVKSLHQYYKMTWLTPRFHKVQAVCGTSNVLVTLWCLHTLKCLSLSTTPYGSIPCLKLPPRPDSKFCFPKAFAKKKQAQFQVWIARANENQQIHCLRLELGSFEHACRSLGSLFGSCQYINVSSMDSSRPAFAVFQSPKWVSSSQFQDPGDGFEQWCLIELADGEGLRYICQMLRRVLSGLSEPGTDDPASRRKKKQIQIKFNAPLTSQLMI